MASKRIKGIIVEIGGDTSPLGKALKEADEAAKKTQSELKDIDRALKEAPDSTVLWKQKQELLTKAIEESKNKLKVLQDAQEEMNRKLESGEIGEETYRNFQREVERAKGELEKLRGELSDTNGKLDDMGNDAKDAGKKLDNMGDDAKDAAKDMDDAGDEAEGFGDKLQTAAGVVAAATTAIVGGLVGCVEASRDYRTEMGKLESAFTSAEHSSESAKETYQELQGILGETEQAVEAAAFIAKIADSEKELATWVDIATGVYATFGNSLPVESLTEAANETAKTGALTGGLADALNWAGVNEEEFQAKLDKCNTEQERQALIAETLIGLYGDTAEAYRINNAEIIEANKASESLNASMAGVGESMEPILNKLKGEGAEIASKILPKVTDFAEDFNDNLPDIIEHVKDLIPLAKGAGTAFVTWKALNGIGSGISMVKKLTDVLKTTSGLAGLTSSGILGIGAALAVGVGSYVYSAKKAEEAKLQEIFEEATEESRNLAEEITNSAEAMKTMKEEADAQVEADKVMIDQTQRLYEELQTLCDKNGIVKAGYEDRVSYITKELEEATGIEIELVDGQIKKYGELKNSIEEVIKKKRAESMEAAYSGAYQQALTDNANASKQYVEAQGIVTENRNEINRLKTKAENAAMAQGKSTSHLGEFTYENRDAWSMFLGGADFESLRAAEANIVNASQSMETLKKTFKQNQADIENYEKATEEMFEGNYSRAQVYYSQIGDLSYASLVDAQSTIDEQVAAVKTACDEALEKYKASLELGDTKAKETFSSTVANIVQQATENGVDAGTLLSSGIIGELEKIDGFDATMLMKFADALGVDFGTVLGNVSVKKAEEIMSQRWSDTNSTSSTPAYQFHFAPKQNKAITAYANGGFHRTGTGIVAEAGPELIEIVNGGAKITPLTDTARNTAIGGTSKPVTIYNTIYANVSSDYDVDTLAERLARKERQINAGKGR